MRILLIILFFLSFLSSKGQLVPLYSQYMMNGLAINPAYAGSRDVFSAAFMYRKQWQGFNGAPLSMTLSAHTPFLNKSLAAGILIKREQFGITENTSYYVNYAFRITTRRGFLSFGLKAGIESFTENDSEISTRDLNDDVFSQKSENFILPNFGAGIYYYDSKYFAGLSLPTILSYRVKSGGNGFEAYNDSKNYNFLLSTGMLINITNTFKIKPSSLIRYYNHSFFQYDLNCNLIFMKDGILWLGASYRSKDSFVGLFEFQINPQFRIGYSYDYTTGDVGRWNGGTHEIMLRYEIRYKAVNPKYF